MNIKITGQGVEVTEALKKAIDEKFNKITHYFNHIDKMEVILRVENIHHIAEGNLHVPGKTLHAKSTESDMYNAVTQLAGKLERQVRDFKEKISNRHTSIDISGFSEEESSSS